MAKRAAHVEQVRDEAAGGDERQRAHQRVLREDREAPAHPDVLEANLDRSPALRSLEERHFDVGRRGTLIAIGNPELSVIRYRNHQAPVGAAQAGRQEVLVPFDRNLERCAHGCEIVPFDRGDRLHRQRLAQQDPRVEEPVLRGGQQAQQIQGDENRARHHHQAQAHSDQRGETAHDGPGYSDTKRTRQWSPPGIA
jgi:hypothetical protein